MLKKYLSNLYKLHDILYKMYNILASKHYVQCELFNKQTKFSGIYILYVPLFLSMKTGSGEVNLYNKNTYRSLFF